ncbi:MAG: NAD-dependent epimerase/dehydratase family protein [bacterium]
MVVGGSGFIGKALIRRLVELDAKVVSLGLRKDKVAQAGDKVHHIVADLCDHTSLSRVLKDPLAIKRPFDYVFNLGGYINHSPYLSGGREVITTHYNGTMNLLDSVYHTHLKAFVQVGSSDEYGGSPAPQRENMRESPISPYSAAKVAATHLIQALSRAEHFPGVVVRLFLVYGEGQDLRRFLPQIIQGCLKDREFPTSAGVQLRDFCYIEDVVEALLRCAVTEKARGEVINIASGQPISVKDLIEKVVTLIGCGRPNFGAYPYRPLENMELYADVEVASKLLGWQPTTSLDEGLRRTIAWYRKEFQG